MFHSKTFRAIRAGLVAALLAGGGWVLAATLSSPASPSTEEASPGRQSAGSASSSQRSSSRLPPGWSYIAVARGPRLHFFRRPTSRRGPVLELKSPTKSKMPLTLLVKERRPGWLETYLPVRPNHSTAWVHRGQVRVLTTAYTLHVHVQSHEMTLEVGDRTARTFSIGVGRSVTPTPNGRYFITDLLRQPDPHGEYGPFVFGLSAHSGVFRHFGRGGDGQIGIHGTDEPWLIGGNVSHGCIRVRNSVITWLAHRLPLGTPVTIGA